MDLGDMGEGSVEVGDPGMGAGDTSQGTTITIVIKGDSITCDGEPCDIGDAMRKVLDAYESQESPDGDEANFQAGLGNSSPPKAGEPAAGGGASGKNGGGY